MYAQAQSILPESQRLCSHCNQPALVPLRVGDQQFCCQGCAGTYETLHALGLTNFYELRDRAGTAGRKVDTTGVELSYFESPAFLSAQVSAVTPGRSRIRLLLSGIHCVGCVWILEKLPTLLPGVLLSELSFAEGLLVVEFDPEQTSPGKIAALLLKLGYVPAPYTISERRLLEEREQRDFLFRLGVAGFGFGNNMIIAVSLYQGIFSGIDPAVRNFLHWVSLVIAFPVVLYAGAPFFRSFLSSLIAKRLQMDVPIAAGITVTLLYSMYNTFTGADRVYYDSVCALVFLLLLGRYFQSTALAKARRGAAEALSLLPMSAEIRRSGKIMHVPLHDIQAQDTVVVAAGSRVPIDGFISSGSSMFNAAVMTGESAPVARHEGQELFAGFLNLEATVYVKPSGKPEESRISKLLALLDEGALQKTPLVESAERILGVFLGIVLALAAGTLVWWLPEGVRPALDATVSLLVICCPCALALATPLALATGVRRAASAGILIRRADVIERTKTIKTIFFDKTGTLTRGIFEVRKMVPYPEFGDRATCSDYARLLAQAGQAHPLSLAILKFLELQDGSARPAATPAPLTSQRWVTGQGVEGQDRDGKLWRLGSSSFTLATQHSEFLGAESVVYLSCEGKPAMRFELADSIDPMAKETLDSLRRRGFSLRLLSGDHRSTVEAVGALLGFRQGECVGECLPEEKQRRIREAGPGTMMVGDGVNDAAALGAAEVSVAMHGDALRCLESADVALLYPDIRLVSELFKGSALTIRAVRMNLAISLAYNVFGAAAAIAGKVDPLVAALVMPLSSLTVLAYSYWAKSFSAQREKV